MRLGEQLDDSRHNVAVVVDALPPQTTRPMLLLMKVDVRPPETKSGKIERLAWWREELEEFELPLRSQK